MTKVSDIARFIEELAPPELAEDWDNVGLLIGSQTQDVVRVMVCLDATMDTVDEAIQKKVDLLVTHHPVMFKGIKLINENDTRSRILMKLIRNNISVYSAHTNLDVAVEGVNEQLANIIGLSDIDDISDGRPGLGKVGWLSETMSFEDFIYMVKVQLEIPYIRVIGYEKDEIRKVAVFCGSFDENWGAIISEAPDVLLTGDIKYHTALEAFEKNICVIDAGHFATEKIIIPVIVKKLQEKFSEIEVIRSYNEKDPIKTI